MAAPSPSPALVRAAGQEAQRLQRAIASVERQRTDLQAQLAALDEQLRQLRERERLLQLLVGDAATNAPTARAAIYAGKLLKGRALRRVAGRLLWQQLGDHEVHYREWLERVLAAGYAVGGQDPAATFLTNMRDSPAVVRGERSGFYRLAPHRREEIMQQVAEAQAELADVTRQLDRCRADRALGADVDALRKHRDDLTARLRRLEADHEELAAIFDKHPDEAQPDIGDVARAAA